MAETTKIVQVPITVEDEERLAAFGKRHNLVFYEIAIGRLLDLADAAEGSVTDELVDRAWAAMTRAENVDGRSMGFSRESMRKALEAVLT